MFLGNETRAKSGFVSYVSFFLCFDFDPNNWVPVRSSEIYPVENESASSLPVCSVCATATKTMTRLGTPRGSRHSGVNGIPLITATNAAFVNRIPQRDSVFQEEGPSMNL